jgi:peptide/nickel transport system substrate-binding protein
MRTLRFAAAAAFALLLCSGALAQTTLKIGLAEDPDILDPSLARTYVGRIVFSSICDKLFDIDEKLTSCRSLHSQARPRPTAKP